MEKRLCYNRKMTVSMSGQRTTEDRCTQAMKEETVNEFTGGKIGEEHGKAHY